MIIVDEAHRGRFRDVDAEKRRQPNQYLRLLRSLSRQTRDLLLLTATPMQLNEVELWALLELLEPDGWNTAEYTRFYVEDSCDLTEWKYRRDLWRKTNPPDNGDYLLSSDNDGFIATQLKEQTVLRSTLETMEHSAPAKHLMSRHTRSLIRHYQEQGLLNMPAPRRIARDATITMKPAERQLYEGIKPLVQQCYGHRRINRQALGFITTIFRKRLGSSTHAYAQTLRNAANRICQNTGDWTTLLDDADLDELPDHHANELNNAANLEALLEAAEEAENLSYSDSKRHCLSSVIKQLRQQNHNHILLFTQFRDTQLWLAEHLRRLGHHITELYGEDAHLGDRGHRLHEFREQPNGLLLCTETASESLNLQFCSAVINYDIPWNPMTLEQRAGRIDRIGQERQVVEVVNLFYEETAEHDAYHAVSRRFENICANVGEYPPIIATGIQRIIRDELNVADEIERLTASQNFDVNRLNAVWEHPTPPAKPRITMADLERPLRETKPLPPGWSARSAGTNHWDVTEGETQ